ncbi:MAG TPA: hypothetical protein VKR55_25500 [Bradyrhizobium sp.]|uniref:hypothetical protein n=1 Tax=Bradyrhizobium sp. TaxID=376 RepID=UPI002BAC65ED|nr:hypothetical protein [Bradyrhizobium sp.]HLZ05492.1 hypothetical protein [Bradyrhizobium sp.]
MTSVKTIAKPIARAIKIYRRVARHDPDTQTRRDLARHIKRLAERGVQDTDRLTVHGLSYLREVDQHARPR